MRGAMIGWMIVALLLLGMSVGRASDKPDKDEAVVTAQVSSADHELEEGYFTLGESATVVAKPGSDLYRFLARQRGHKIKMVLTESSGPELSKLVR